jgi:hypothetical protein
MTLRRPAIARIPLFVPLSCRTGATARKVGANRAERQKIERPMLVQLKVHKAEIHREFL